MSLKMVQNGHVCMFFSSICISANTGGVVGDSHTSYLSINSTESSRVAMGWGGAKVQPRQGTLRSSF